MGGMPRKRWEPVQVASIDTLHRMEHPPGADVIICDEAHGALSPTWRKTLERYPHAKIIGMTATPIRLDQQGLGRQSGGLFDALVQGPTEADLIQQGFLVRSRVLAPPAPADLGRVGKVAGEFNTKQMAAVCDKAKVIGDIVSHWRKHANGRKTAAFGVDQKHAQHITEQFREAGVQWAYVDAETPDSERDRIWADLDNPGSGLCGVSSVGCISVGWDHPVVSCLIAARKTASLGLWRQMLGRGSRPAPGKDHFLVLDHVGNTHQHAPYGMFEDEVPWKLDGAAVAESEEKAEAVTTCKACYATFKTGPTECPYCGALLPPRRARKVEVVAGELQEITPTVRNNERIARAVYEALVKKAKSRNYKDNYPDVVFRKVMGFEPSRHWREA
jgi:superfamily II DNA or RNA helicase